MGTWVLLATALALAVDAFTVAVASGLSLDNVDGRKTFRLSWHFGFFQSLMTFLGWAAGLAFRALIEGLDHWVAFGLLLFVGARMIIHAVRGDADEEKPEKPRDPTRGANLVLLSVAVSIDALAVGLSLALLDVSIWTPVLVIGVVALVMTAAGLHLGRVVRSTARLGRAAEVVGGLVLLGIGVHILHEHGVFRSILGN